MLLKAGLHFTCVFLLWWDGVIYFSLPIYRIYGKWIARKKCLTRAFHSVTHLHTKGQLLPNKLEFIILVLSTKNGQSRQHCPWLHGFSHRIIRSQWLNIKCVTYYDFFLLNFRALLISTWHTEVRHHIFKRLCKVGWLVVGQIDWFRVYSIKKMWKKTKLSFFGKNFTDSVFLSNLYHI